MVDEALADLAKQLEQARREAAYYRKLAKDSGERRLRESEAASQIIVQLKQAEQELAQSRDELEQRVLERTAELSQTNERLLQEMQERHAIEEALRQANEQLQHANQSLDQERNNLEQTVRKRTQELVRLQEERLRELSTPLIPIMDQVVIMPLIGTIDAQRAQQVLETMLEGVAQHQASIAILDITGVRTVDTQVAQALIRTAQAVKLLGARVLLTGVGPQIAQTLVQLEVDLRDIATCGSLQAGIAAVFGSHARGSKPALFRT